MKVKELWKKLWKKFHTEDSQITLFYKGNKINKGEKSILFLLHFTLIFSYRTRQIYKGF